MASHVHQHTSEHVPVQGTDALHVWMYREHTFSMGYLLHTLGSFQASSSISVWVPAGMSTLHVFIQGLAILNYSMLQAMEFQGFGWGQLALPSRRHRYTSTYPCWQRQDRMLTIMLHQFLLSSGPSGFLLITFLATSIDWLLPYLSVRTPHLVLAQIPVFSPIIHLKCMSLAPNRIGCMGQ